MSRNHRLLIMAVAGMGILACLPRFAAGATVYVATNGADSRTGLGDWTNAVATISNGIAKAAENDTVLVSNGTYLLAAAISIINGITLRAFSTNPADTIIDGNAAYRCLSVNHANAVVDGFTIANGLTPASGGGIFLQAGVAQNCIVISNKAQVYGGGIWLTDGCLAQGCVIQQNTATNATGSAGGGVYLDRGGLVRDCTIAGNLSKYGGGVNMEGNGSVNTGLVTSCIIRDNSATMNAGGIYLNVLGVAADCVISNNTSAQNGGGIYTYLGGVAQGCAIRNNAGENGGGVYNNAGGAVLESWLSGNSATGSLAASSGRGGGAYVGSASTLRGCLILGNVSSNEGGGVYANQGYISNCTIIGNTSLPGAGSLGGGLCIQGANTRINNSIIYYNIASTANRSNWYQYDTARFTNSCTAPSGVTGSGNIFVDPLFTDTNAADYSLQANSQCINAGLNAAWMNGVRDVRGHNRLDVFTRIVDMGACEFVREGCMFTFR